MAKTSKTPKAPKSFKSYALNKCLIGYGVVNGIINAAIFAGINAGAPDAMFGMHDIVHDLAFTGLLLGMLLFACVVPLTRMDLRKGVFSLPGAAGGAFPLVSSSYAVSILGVGALAAVVMTGAGALLSLALPAAGATVTGMMFLKGLVCALGGAVAGWCAASRRPTRWRPPWPPRLPRQRSRAICLDLRLRPSRSVLREAVPGGRALFRARRGGCLSKQVGNESVARRWQGCP